MELARPTTQKKAARWMPGGLCRVRPAARSHAPRLGRVDQRTRATEAGDGLPVTDVAALAPVVLITRKR